MSHTFQILPPLPIIMPRLKQAKLAEPKKRSASTKSVADEELPTKRAKALKNPEQRNSTSGILDKCLFCSDPKISGGAGSYRFFFNLRCFTLRCWQGFTLRPSTTSQRASSKTLLLPIRKTSTPVTFRWVQAFFFYHISHPQPCSQRKLGYKELVLHLATQHQLLKQVLVLHLANQHQLLKQLLTIEAWWLAIAWRGWGQVTSHTYKLECFIFTITLPGDVKGQAAWCCSSACGALSRRW